VTAPGDRGECEPTNTEIRFPAETSAA
jgi:hypothetical protein